MQENGGWPPHLHFQIILDLLERDADFPGVARSSEPAVWTSLSPDPNLLRRIVQGSLPPEHADTASTFTARREPIVPNLSVSYRRPLKIVRGCIHKLFD